MTELELVVSTLEKYIKRVGDCEGVIFIADDLVNGKPFQDGSPPFTEEEFDILCKAAYGKKGGG